MHKYLTRTFLAVAILALIGFGDCAGVDASNQRSLLGAAGFHTHAPATPKQRELFTAATAYQVQRVSYEGRVFYIYKDEKNGLAYVGGEEAYQNYQQLAVQKHVEAAQYQAAQMNRNAAMGWSAAYGSRAVRPGAFPR